MTSPSGEVRAITSKDSIFLPLPGIEV